MVPEKMFAGKKSPRKSVVCWRTDRKIYRGKLRGVQNIELSNVEQPGFRNFKMMNIKIAKDELFDYFLYNFFLFILFIS